ncbi:MAG: VWA domain-containing protein [Elusimicrobiaceae bacterium]
MQLFRNPLILLWILAAAVAAAAAVFYSARRKTNIIKRLALDKMYPRLTQEESERRKWLKTILFMTALGFLFLAWAGPQWGVEMKESEAEVSHAVIAVDTSLSMMAKDIKPTRLENAKQMINILLSDLKDYRTGVIAFAGKAFIQCPITTDETALKYFVDFLSPGLIPFKGTNIGAAVDLSAVMLQKYPGKKALILITDGEDHEGKLDDAIKNAKNAGIAIFAIGIGSPEGEVIPTEDGGSQLTGYRKDDKGQTIVTRLDEKTLIKLAAETGGAYIRYTGPEEVSTKIAEALKSLSRSKWKGKNQAQYKNRYQIPLLIGIILLLLEMLIPERRMTFRLRKHARRTEEKK